MRGVLTWTLLLLATAPAALGAELSASLGGLEQPRSVVLMGVPAGGLASQAAHAGCRDTGDGGDAAVDGVFTCASLELPAGEVHLALSLDGRLQDLGTVVLGEGGTSVQVQREPGGLTLSTGPGLLAPQEGAKAAGGVPLVVGRVSGDFSQGAPIMRIVGPAGNAQAPCRDDGTFPDGTRNDEVQACAGPATGAEVALWVQGAGSQAFEVGKVAVDPGATVVFVDVDLTARSATLAPDAAWPWPPPPKEEALAPTPGPDPVPPEPGPDPSPPEVGPEPQAPQPLIDRAAPQAQVGAASTVGRGLIDVFALLAALAAGLGLAWVVLPRGPRLPEGVDRLDAARPFSPGPSLAEPAAVFEAQDPVAFLGALLTRLSRSRAVFLVAPAEVDLPPLSGETVYRTEARDWEEVDRQLRALQRATGRTPLVLVLGRERLTAPGAVADDGAVRLAEALPAGSWLGLVVAPGSEAVGFLTPWRAVRGEGGGWRLEEGN